MLINLASWTNSLFMGPTQWFSLKIQFRLVLRCIKSEQIATLTFYGLFWFNFLISENVAIVLESVMFNQNFNLINFIFTSFDNCQNSSSCEMANPPSLRPARCIIWVRVFNKITAKMAFFFLFFRLSQIKIIMLVTICYSHLRKKWK